MGLGKLTCSALVFFKNYDVPLASALGILFANTGTLSSLCMPAAHLLPVFCDMQVNAGLLVSTLPVKSSGTDFFPPHFKEGI